MSILNYFGCNIFGQCIGYHDVKVKVHNAIYLRIKINRKKIPGYFV